MSQILVDLYPAAPPDGVVPKDLYLEYESRAEDSLVRRTVRNHLDKLARYGFVDYEGKQQSRRYWPATTRFDGEPVEIEP